MSNSKRHIRFGNHRITLYKRDDIEVSSYFMRIYLKHEKRYFKKSLHTMDVDEAASKAQNEVINLLAKIQAGERVVSISIGDLLRRFQVHQQELATSGQLSPKTVSAQAYRVRNLAMGFLATKGIDANSRLASLDGAIFHDYLKWRMEKKATIRRDVVRDELLVIRKMFLYAKKNKWCSDKAIPNWDFVIEKEGPKRERITGPQQWRDFINTTSAWAKEKPGYGRRMLLQIVGLVALSGMRSGEVFGLKNADVAQKGKSQYTIHIRAETSKVRRSRAITVHSDLLDVWIEKLQRYKAPGDYFFSAEDKGRVSARDTFYHLYKALRDRLKDVGLEWFDLYHARHWYVTNQLLAEQPIHLVAKVAGTSVKEIESTYSHVLTELTSENFSKRKIQWNPDGNYEIVKRLIK